MRYEEYMLESVCFQLGDMVINGTLTCHQAHTVFNLALEKYGIEGDTKPIKYEKNMYIRFGEIPKNGKSKIHRSDAILGEEKGLSVWHCIKSNDIEFPVLPDITNEAGIADYFYFLFGTKPVYLVTGEELSEKGSVGEPLIINVTVVKDLTKDYEYLKSMHGWKRKE